MRGATPVWKRGLAAALRPILLSLLALAGVWAALAIRDGAALSFRFGTEAFFDAETLLSLGSPLLARRTAEPEPLEPPEPIRSEPGESGDNEPPEMVPTLAPYMTPELSAEEPPSQKIEFWDDRVWSIPSEADPKARPVREITLLPMNGDEYLTDGTVTVNNDTRYTLDIPALLERTSKLIPGEEGPQILLIHTHGSESFLPDERDFYIPTDIERTEDTRYNVVRIGDEIEARLTEIGLGVVHDRTIYDYPTFSDSYVRSLSSIQTYIEQYPTIQVVLDIHRDSISQADGTAYKPVCESEYGKTAQLMFVAGSDDMGLPHDNWRDNLAFAAQLQRRLLAACPTLMRPIHLREERFNQHATPGSLILEVGTAANTLTEALRAANLFCDAVGEYLLQLTTHH
ncbi:MAG: stage II sporulation protein P [Oscillospiraceae bacterium]|jgi:stage II sporulation protein P|nr:stage II sporulation protein P [Oscillospiraceae bacterium]